MYKSKDRSRSEREKLREMNFGEKLSYIWAYYNYQIVGVVIAIAVIIGVTHSCSTRQDIGLFIAWSASYLEFEQEDALKDVLNEHVLDSSPKEAAEVSLFIVNDDDPTFTLNYLNRMVAMLTAGTIDVFILDEDTMSDYSRSEFIWSLDVILNDIKASDPALYEIISNETVSIPFGLDENNQIIEIMGVRITDSPLVNRLGFRFNDDAFFCMAISTQRLDRVRETLKLFFAPIP